MTSLPRTPVPVVPGLTLLERLQDGPAGAVWRAQTDAGELVVAKALPTDLDRNNWRSIQRGFRRAVNRSVSGVLAPTKLVSDGDWPHVQRPWVDGVPLLDAIRTVPDGPARVARACALGAAAARTLARLAQAGLVHGHLAPDDLWQVGSDTVWITDLGTTARDILSSSGVRPGWLPPPTPEALAGHPQGHAADVLALGALLHAALLPEGAASVSTTTPMGPSARERMVPLALRHPAVSHGLSHLLDRTQALDPHERPTAAELARALVDPRLHRTPAVPPACPTFVGRTSMRRSLAAHLDATEPRLAWISGPSGAGRRRLADALARDLLHAGFLPLRVRCDRAETGSLPRRLLRALLAAPIHRARRHRVIGSAHAAAVMLEPQLAADLAPPSTESRLDAGALVEDLSGVVARAVADRPRLLWIDALEDADPLSVRALRRLLDLRVELPIIATVERRWAPPWVVRTRERLESHAAVRCVDLGDLSPTELHGMARAYEVPREALPAVACSPARAAEAALHWRATAEDRPSPDPAAGLASLALVPPPLSVPVDVLRRLDADTDALVARGFAERSPLGGLTATPLAAMGLHGTDRRDRVAQRLADTLPESCAELRARLRLLDSDHQDTRCDAIVAALSAWHGGDVAKTHRWLWVVDRLPRTTSARYARLRPALAGCRAEAAHWAPHSPPRPALVEQAVRRGCPHPALAQGLLALRQSNLPQALSHLTALVQDDHASDLARDRALVFAIDTALRLADHTAVADLSAQARSRRGPTAIAAQARALAGQGSWVRAATLLDRVDGLTDSLPPVRGLLPWLLRAAGAQERLLQQLDTLLEPPATASALTLQATVQLDGWAVRDAWRTRKRIDRSWPLTHPDHHARLAILDLRLARARGESASELVVPQAVCPAVRAEAYTALIDCAEPSEDSVQQAISAQQTHPSGGVAWGRLALGVAWACVRRGELPLAAEHATTAEQAAQREGLTELAHRARLVGLHARGRLAPRGDARLRASRDADDPILRADALELTARAALSRGDRAQVLQSTRALAELASVYVHHGCAERARVLQQLARPS